ncbi:IclR family transcriptional regulator C-terminal domain-containing protein [Knoellia sp. p5-6-4]|uniref:IclR family transcriptional regulator domain-containing protein n=1 Tax=unclassified Knoellia TaxID=2618719 RepID=UPI0023DBC880|nr:IclR family transcriptional regulator C-terminal domain-containing protein [Knoellia sp. p5-6-4]MDF2146036.1 IclR family transcriptional regulator C-terminal domain-containing protein [Knoellia sp. p5-6-4]
MSAEDSDVTHAPSGEFVQSLARGFAVIRAFDEQHPQLTLSEVARRANLSRATARRFLFTLVTLGYMRTDGREFALTPRVLQLGYAYLSGLRLPEVAEPHLKQLSEEVGESTSASVLDGDDVVYVARVHTRRIMTVAINVGTRFPAYATSMGRVLLAHLPPEQLQAYLDRVELRPLTPRTITSREELAKALGLVREQGWASVDQELEAGLRSVAVPVRGRDGSVVAALNVSMRVGFPGEDPHRVEQVLPAALAAAQRISADLALGS